MRLKVDPRSARLWPEYGITQLQLPLEWMQPRPVQRKMLALASSGVSVLAQSMPGMGKSTAALVSVLNTTRVPDKITNLVLVPTPTLAEQYFRIGNMLKPGSCQALYRTGSEPQDEHQHQQLATSPHTLVTTPTRLLDYLHWDPSFLKLSPQNLVIDELDVYGSGSKNGSRPLDLLLEYIFGRWNPAIIALLTPTPKIVHIPEPLVGKELQSVAEEAPQWCGQTQVWDSTGKSLPESVFPSSDEEIEDTATLPVHDAAKWVRSLQRAWEGPGLVVIPRSLSVTAIETEAAQRSIPAVVVKETDVAGIHIPDLDRIYVLGIDSATNFEKLRWTLGNSTDKTLSVILASPSS